MRCVAFAFCVRFNLFHVSIPFAFGKVYLSHGSLKGSLIPSRITGARAAIPWDTYCSFFISVPLPVERSLPVELVFLRFQPLFRRRRIGGLYFSNFNPCAVSTMQAGWVTQEGFDITQEMAVHNFHWYTSFVESVVAGQVTADMSLLLFGDPSRFVAGELYNHASVWSKIASFAAPSHASEVIDWIVHRVNVKNCFQSFKGSSKGEDLVSPVSLRRVFHYNPLCIPFSHFISNTIIEQTGLWRHFPLGYG